MGKKLQVGGSLLGAHPWRPCYILRISTAFKVKVLRPNAHENILQFLKNKTEDCPERHTTVVFRLRVSEQDKPRMNAELGGGLRNVMQFEDNFGLFPGMMKSWIIVTRDEKEVKLASELIKHPVERPVRKKDILLFCLFLLPKDFNDPIFTKRPKKTFGSPKTIAEVQDTVLNLQKMLLPYKMLEIPKKRKVPRPSVLPSKKRSSVKGSM
mmetsp:Transcript_2053/g.2937  ORF Transcript_2053/g.2937 Transcript_2053/m.2937 type:complete len:210 (-) Transcript_2053:113-742(-)